MDKVKYQGGFWPKMSKVTSISFLGILVLVCSFYSKLSKCQITKQEMKQLMFPILFTLVISIYYARVTSIPIRNIVINEFGVRPLLHESGRHLTTSFIELRNIGKETVNLKDWRLLFRARDHHHTRHFKIRLSRDPHHLLNLHCGELLVIQPKGTHPLCRHSYISNQDFTFVRNMSIDIRLENKRGTCKDYVATGFGNTDKHGLDNSPCITPAFPPNLAKGYFYGRNNNHHTALFTDWSPESARTTTPCKVNPGQSRRIRFCRHIGMKGDPHIAGFNGQTFDFHGAKKQVFNLISDTFLQLNSRFVGADLRSNKNKTYMGEIALQSGEDKLLVKCDVARDGLQYIVAFNGEQLEPQMKVNTKFTEVYRTQDDKVVIEVPRYRFIINFSSSKHSTCHLNMRAKYRAGDYPKPHGILGQTANISTVKKSLGMQGEGIIEGVWMDYRIVGDELFGKQFKFNRFDETAPLPNEKLEAMFEWTDTGAAW